MPTSTGVSLKMFCNLERQPANASARSAAEILAGPYTTPGITDRMLTLHLRELEKDGLVERTVYAEVPPRVEYKITESAMSLIPIWQELEHWGIAHKERTLHIPEPQH